MPVLMMLELPGATAEQYDRIQHDILRMETEDDAPEGLISHVAGHTGDALLVVDVWESERAIGRFAESRMKAALAEGGIDPQTARPRILPIHNLIVQGAGTDARLVLVVELPGFAPADYDAMVAGADAHRDGGRHHPAVSHAAAVTDGGLVVVDVWDSQATFERFFREQIAAGTTERLPAIEPRFVPVRNRLRGRAPQPAA